MDVYLRLFGNQMTSSFLVVIVSVVPSLLLSYVETTLTFVCPSCRSTMCQPSHPFSSLIAYQVHGGSSDGARSSCHCVGHRLSQGQPRLTDHHKIISTPVNLTCMFVDRPSLSTDMHKTREDATTHAGKGRRCKHHTEGSNPLFVELGCPQYITLIYLLFHCY